MKYEKTPLIRRSTVLMFLIGIGIGAIIGLAIIDSTKYNNCEHMSNLTGTQRWVECNQ